MLEEGEEIEEGEEKEEIFISNTNNINDSYSSSIYISTNDLYSTSNNVTKHKIIDNQRHYDKSNKKRKVKSVIENETNDYIFDFDTSDYYYCSFLNSLHYTFRNINYLHHALTHPSYSNSLFQRLEHLGDSVLNFVITIELFAKYFDKDEGYLAKSKSILSSNETLKDLSYKFHICDIIRVRLDKERDIYDMKILADCIEAIIGAIFLDSYENIQVCRDFIKFHWAELLAVENILECEKDFNPIGYLYEECQKYKFNVSWETLIQDESFLVYLTLVSDINISLYKDIKVLTIGNGKNIHDAKKDASRQMINQLSQLTQSSSLVSPDNSNPVIIDYISKLMNYIPNMPGVNRKKLPKCEFTFQSIGSLNIPIHQCCVHIPGYIEEKIYGDKHPNKGSAKMSAAKHMLIHLGLVNEKDE